MRTGYDRRGWQGRGCDNGLSIMATAFSAINYTAFSGEVSRHGLYVALSLPVFVIVVWPVTRIIMPFYHSMQLCSAYEYMERRFDVRVRTLASGLFILWGVAWMAVALFVPCRVLSTVTGLSFYVVVLVAGGVAILYAMAGGVRAVMWTDVVQFFVLLGGGWCSAWRLRPRRRRAALRACCARAWMRAWRGPSTRPTRGCSRWTRPSALRCGAR